MKRILFIIGTLDSGGVAKSIVNLLNAINYSGKEIHLLKMSASEGPFSKYIPQDVTIHHIPETGWLLNGWGGVKQLLKHGHLLLALGAVLRMILSRIDKPSAGWLLAQLFPALPGEWDTIVDYNGQQDFYYMVDKLKGGRKITFFHSDYHKWPYYERMDRKYFPKVDAICTISEQCVKSLQDVFPEVTDKVKLVPNISLPSMIHKLAEETVEMPELHGTILVTVGHVCYNKGIDLIISASRNLKDKGIDFTWLLVGSTDGAEDYLKEIAESDLADCIVPVGVQSNPYAFMKMADIIVHPSRFEGKSITLDEAKILCKPIVVTNFSTVHDQFEDGVNASICEMKPSNLADSIRLLLIDENRQKQFAETLQNKILDLNYLTNVVETIL